MPGSSDTIAWMPPQRRVLLLLTTVVVLYIGFRLLRDRTTVADPPPLRGARLYELRDRIDPNTADIATLAALPGLGEKRATDIVNLREQLVRKSPGRPAFARPEDLLKVSGIGAVMMMQLTPYLVFPSANTATTKAGTIDEHK